MSDDARADHEHAEDDHAEHGHDVEGVARETAPMQAFSMRQVWTGAVIAVVGVAVAFVLPFLLA